jgi:hypothetical protein
VNSILSVTYGEIVRRVFEHEENQLALPDEAKLTETLAQQRRAIQSPIDGKQPA